MNIKPEMIEIISFDRNNSKHKIAFLTLNSEWLEKYFKLEEIDKLILSNPEDIIAKGGQILFATFNNELIGTISLIKSEDNEFELCKLAVTEAYKGLKIGQKLTDSLIDYSKKIGIKKLYLASNTKLNPAITLYRKIGFIDSKEDRHSGFERGNITMELNL